MMNILELTVKEQEIYHKLMTKMPESIADESVSDLRFYVALLSIIISANDEVVEDWYKELNPYTASESALRSMSLLVGYVWESHLPVEYNRTRLIYYMYRRKYRGTIASIKNLIRSTAGEVDFYSNNLNSEINVIEMGATIRLEIPDHLYITRQDIEEVRPAGTVLEFLLHTLYGLLKLPTKVKGTELVDDTQLGEYFSEFIYQWRIYDYVDQEGNIIEDTTMAKIWNRPLTMYSLSTANTKVDTDVEVIKED